MQGVGMALANRVLVEPVAHAGGLKAPAAVFNEIFRVFLGLGTLVGVVVVSYTLYNAYKYRDDGEETDEAERPEMGELPTGGGGGKKLALSFTLSAAIVIGLIIWTYMTLLYIETAPSSDQAQQQALAQNQPGDLDDLDPITVDVIGHRFSWEFIYPNGASTTGTMRVPKNRVIRLNVTSADVFHNIGVPELRVKADAVPGQQTSAWFVGKEVGTYEAQCYELCGSGHSYMTADVEVLTQSAYADWYNTTEAAS
jgi:cytochrome c oxidase subunit 2